MTIFAFESTSRTFDFQAGDVGYVPMSMAHYVEHTGTTTMLVSRYFRERSLQRCFADAMAGTHATRTCYRASHDRALVDAICAQKRAVVPSLEQVAS